MDSDLPPLYSQDFTLEKFDKKFQSSARAKEIHKRSTLNSADGKTRDDHDQFYKDHKLLLKLFQVLGVMPIQRGRIGTITFSWISIPTIYAYCFYVITSILVVLVGYERVMILTNESHKFDEYIYSIIFIIYLVPHFWIPIVGWGVAKEVCNYKNSWGHFQLHYYKITGKGLVFPHLSILIIIISSGCLILTIVFLLTLTALFDGFTLYHTIAYYHIITMINMNCALWYINCRAIGDASKCVAESFDKDMKKHISAYLISHYRLLWLKLSNILQGLGNAYARTYSTYALFMLTNITISVYGFTSDIVDNGFRITYKQMGLVIDTLYCAVLLVVFCNCSHQATINIANKVQFTLMEVDLSKIDIDATREIELFLTAIQMNPPKVSLQGYVLANRQLISSVVGTVAIYLIVLLQFKISLLKYS